MNLKFSKLKIFIKFALWEDAMAQASLESINSFANNCLSFLSSSLLSFFGGEGGCVWVKGTFQGATPKNNNPPTLKKKNEKVSLTSN